MKTTFIKTIGLVIIAIGIILTVLSGIDFITSEKVVNAGRIELTHNKIHRFNWSPMIGIATLVVGAGISFFGKRNYNSIHISK
jgi:hypothetical protein